MEFLIAMQFFVGILVGVSLTLCVFLLLKLNSLGKELVVLRSDLDELDSTVADVLEGLGVPAKFPLDLTLRNGEAHR